MNNFISIVEGSKRDIESLSKEIGISSDVSLNRLKALLLAIYGLEKEKGIPGDIKEYIKKNSDDVLYRSLVDISKKNLELKKKIIFQTESGEFLVDDEVVVTETVKDDLLQKNSQIETLNKKLSSTEERINVLMLQNKELSEKVSLLNNELSEKRISEDNEISLKLEGEKQNMRTLLEQERKKFTDNYNLKVTELEKEKERLATILEQERRKITDNYNLKVTELEKEKERMRTILEEEKELMRTILEEEKKKNKNFLDRRIAEIQTENESLQKRINSQANDSFLKEKEKLSSEISNLNSKINLLVQEKKDLTDEINKRNERIGIINVSLEKQDARIENLERELNKEREKTAFFKEQIDNSKKEREIRDEQIIEEIRKQAQDEIHELQNSFETEYQKKMSSVVSIHEQEMNSLQSKFLQLLVENSTLRESTLSVVSQKEESIKLKYELEQKTRDLERAMNDINVCQNEYERLYSIAEEEINKKLELKISEHKKMLDEKFLALKSEMDLEKEKLQNYKNSLDEKLAKNNIEVSEKKKSLETRFSELKNEIDEERFKLQTMKQKFEGEKELELKNLREDFEKKKKEEINSLRNKVEDINISNKQKLDSKIKEIQQREDEFKNLKQKLEEERGRIRGEYELLRTKFNEKTLELDNIYIKKLSELEQNKKDELQRIERAYEEKFVDSVKKQVISGIERYKEEYSSKKQEYEVKLEKLTKEINKYELQMNVLMQREKEMNHIFTKLQEDINSRMETLSLLSKGNVNDVNVYKFLSSNIMSGNITVLQQYLNSENANFSDEKGITLLHLAASKGNFDIVKLLLKKGSNPLRKDFNGKLPVDYVSKNNSDVIRLLDSSNNLFMEDNPLFSWQYVCSVDEKYSPFKDRIPEITRKLDINVQKVPEGQLCSVISSKIQELKNKIYSLSGLNISDDTYIYYDSFYDGENIFSISKNFNQLRMGVNPYNQKKYSGETAGRLKEIVEIYSKML